MNRRSFLMTPAVGQLTAEKKRRRPNVVLILTDDQGYGDLGIHGNNAIRTPNMDRLGREGVQFTRFHVSPVCSPTRSSLLTGRYNYRTGIVDTFRGRSLMHPEEVTLAEILCTAGYRTGIFGKWHLGDNYPMRAMDQGFEEALVIRGGGLSQPSDYPESTGYFDPILNHNGTPRRFRGYCSDIYTNEALQFMERNRSRPFFLYLATNAPHSPLEIADSYVEPYRKAGLNETLAKTYGMITNMDDNIGRVLSKLQELGLEQNTMVLFLTDNGPQQPRFNGNMRGTKGTVYEGGIRVPFFIRWPAAVQPGTMVDRLAAHIDVTPTLAELCGATLPKGRKIDGRSLAPLLLQKGPVEWPDRTLFFQWHRGDEPELFRDCAARNQRWKLVNGKELYDLETDPAESRDVSAQNPAITTQLRREYQAWFQDVSSERGYAPPRIQIGTRHENPVLLTRQDWRGPRAGNSKDSLGHWELLTTRRARYEISVRMAPLDADGQLRFALNGVSLKQPLKQGTQFHQLGILEIPAGPGRLEIEISATPLPIGVNYVEIRKV